MDHRHCGDIALRFGYHELTEAGAELEVELDFFASFWWEVLHLEAGEVVGVGEGRCSGGRGRGAW